MSKPIVTAIASFGMSGVVFQGPSLKVFPQQFKIHKILERTRNISAERYPEATIVRSYDDILNDPEVELVLVNTPDYLHFEMAKQALEALREEALRYDDDQCPNWYEYEPNLKLIAEQPHLQLLAEQQKAE